MIPDSMAAAVSHIKVKICLAIEQAHAGWEGMPPQTAERLWKVFVALDGLLFSESAVPSDNTRRQRLQERMHWILAGQWDAAWLSMEAQTRQSTGIRGQEDKMGARVRRVTELARAGEMSRAAAAVWPQGDMADAAAVVNKFRTTQMPDPPGGDVNMQAAPGQAAQGRHPRPGERHGASELRHQVAAHLKGQFGRYPRRGGAGPAGGRYEHWAPLKHDEEGAAAVAGTLARLATGDMPPGALAALLAARLAGIPKATPGDVRVLGCGNVARRMVGRSAAKVFHREMREAAGEQQFGLAKDGCGALHRRLCTLANARPGKWVVAVDLGDAFSNLPRELVKHAIRDKIPGLIPLAEEWLPDQTNHVAGGGAHPAQLVKQIRGLDQGCPMSPGFYSVGTADDLVLGRDAVRSKDPQGDCLAFLDDTYFVGTADAALGGLAVWKTRIEAHGMKLKMSKTQIWSPDPDAVLPEQYAQYAQYRVNKLKAVGSTMAYADNDVDGDWRDVPLTDFSRAEGLAEEAGAADAGVAPGVGGHREPPALPCGEEFLVKQGKYFRELLLLHKNGLAAFDAFQLARIWSRGACVHLQRALPLTEAWARRVDDGVVAFFANLLGVTEIPREQVFVKCRDGGFGFGSAVARGPAALLASWESGIRSTAAELGETTAVGLWRRWNGLGRALSTADVAQGRLADGRAPQGDRWQGLLEGRKGTDQKTYTGRVQEHATKAYLATLPPAEAAAVHGASGSSASAWLDNFEGVSPLADHAFIIAAKRRMHLPLLIAESACQNRPSALNRALALAGPPCGRQVDVHCVHALNCPRGGGPVRRHNAIRDAVALWLRDVGHHAQIEQVIPEWHTEAEGAAMLDVVYHRSVHGRICLDVSLVDTVAVALSGRTFQATLQRREKLKHRRYPFMGLVPFVIDINGRWGAEAETWLRRAVGELAEPERIAARCSLRSAVARALQGQVAEQIALATNDAVGGPGVAPRAPH